MTTEERAKALWLAYWPSQTGGSVFAPETWDEMHPTLKNYWITKAEEAEYEQWRSRREGTQASA